MLYHEVSSNVPQDWQKQLDLCLACPTSGGRIPTLASRSDPVTAAHSEYRRCFPLDGAYSGVSQCEAGPMQDGRKEKKKKKLGALMLRNRARCGPNGASKCNGRGGGLNLDWKSSSSALGRRGRQDSGTGRSGRAPSLSFPWPFPWASNAGVLSLSLSSAEGIYSIGRYGDDGVIYCGENKAIGPCGEFFFFFSWERRKDERYRYLPLDA